MTRGNMYWLAFGLAIAGFICLLWGISLMGNDVRSHLANSYREYNRDADGIRYACDGSPGAAAGDITALYGPEARANDLDSVYLRYDDDIVIVGPDLDRPCSIRIEDTDARYSSGGFIFLGPGFTPGSPSGGSGGSPGGPGGNK